MTKMTLEGVIWRRPFTNCIYSARRNDILTFKLEKRSFSAFLYEFLIAFNNAESL